MIIKVLSENTSLLENLGCEHGLSLYIETAQHKLLFDTGASSLFAENAEKLGVDLSKVDMAVLSHGHYDHGGGLETFLRINRRAKVYVHRKSFGAHYAKRPSGGQEYIGLDPALIPNERFQFCDGYCKIDEGLELYAGVKGKKLLPSSNADLLLKDGDGYGLDLFAHEQNLFISAGDKSLLLTGCAHNGIVNIVEHFKEEKGRWPDYVIGGFHLNNHGTEENESPEVVDEIARILLETGARYYAGHCTGLLSYHRLEAIMAEKIHYLSTGDQITIDA